MKSIHALRFTYGSKVVVPIAAFLCSSVYAATSTKLAITTSAQTLGVGTCSTGVKVQRQTSSGTGNATTSSTKVSLSGSNLTFYSNSTCTTAVTYVTIARYATYKTFYFKSTVVGVSTLTASANGLTSATQAETLTAGLPASVVIGQTIPSQIAGAKITPSIDVQLLDAYGNAAGTSAYTVTASLGSNPGGATLTGTTSGSTATTGAKGMITFSDLTISGGGNGYTLKFSVAASSSTTVSGTSNSFNVSGTVVASPSPTPTATVTASPSPTPTVTATPSPSPTPTATATASPSATPSAAVSGVPASVVISTTIPSQTSGVKVTPSIDVQLKDAYGNAAGNVSYTVTASIGTNPGGATLAGTTSGGTATSGAKGMITFSDLTLSGGGGSYTLKFSVNNGTTTVSGLTNSFNVTSTTSSSPSPTPTATATASPSPTPTATATASPSPTPTATATASPSPTATPSGSSALSAVWFNSGEDKVTRDELRVKTQGAAAVVNRTWDGTKIKMFGARNETVSFNAILEAATTGVNSVSVKMTDLTSTSGSKISSVSATGNDVFVYNNRNIELFYIRYLAIKGLSQLSYNSSYDERHVPSRLRRPYDSNGTGSGTWYDRPDHDKEYPEIAVPIEWENTFSVSAATNQAIWADVYIPKTAVAETYSGSFQVYESGVLTRTIPVELSVKAFTLPDTNTAKTMLYLGYSDIGYRYTGVSYPNSGSAEATKLKAVRDRHFQMARRHRISLIDANYGPETFSSDRPRDEWINRLNGNLYSSASGYDGPGVNTPHDVFAIGAYGSWSWASSGEAGMRTHTDAWETWFQANSSSTERFLYLIDESTNYTQTEQWAGWVKNNPGIGKALPTFATGDMPSLMSSTPSLTVAASWFQVGITSAWEAAQSYFSTSPKMNYLYNGKRPAQGSFATEDDGVSLRLNPWIQFKKNINRWFFWESAYYNNYQAGMGHTDVYNDAKTFGGDTSMNSSYGRTGWNYSNGDGVMFYPGTDSVYPSSNYGYDGPVASLRLKHWRRGLQDAEYLALAKVKNATQTNTIVATRVPKVLWDLGVNDVNDPTWVRSDISWSTNPDDWESSREQLSTIITTP